MLWKKLTTGTDNNGWGSEGSLDYQKFDQAIELNVIEFLYFNLAQMHIKT